MSSSLLSTTRLAIAAAGCSVLLAVGLPLATAAPATDGQGYIDSTARCITPDTVVVFGSTDSSRVAICRTPGGQYQYRGVRVRDGSKLILPASQSGDGGFVADTDGVAYMVTANSLVVTARNRVIREEPWSTSTGRERPKLRQGRQRRRRRRRRGHPCLPRWVTADASAARCEAKGTQTPDPPHCQGETRCAGAYTGVYRVPNRPRRSAVSVLMCPMRICQ